MCVYPIIVTFERTSWPVLSLYGDGCVWIVLNDWLNSHIIPHHVIKYKKQTSHFCHFSVLYSIVFLNCYFFLSSKVMLPSLMYMCLLFIFQPLVWILKCSFPCDPIVLMVNFHSFILFLSTAMIDACQISLQKGNFTDFPFRCHECQCYWLMGFSVISPHFPFYFFCNLNAQDILYKS